MQTQPQVLSFITASLSQYDEDTASVYCIYSIGKTEFVVTWCNDSGEFELTESVICSNALIENRVLDAIENGDAEENADRSLYSYICNQFSAADCQRQLDEATQQSQLDSDAQLVPAPKLTADTPTLSTLNSSELAKIIDSTHFTCQLFLSMPELMGDIYLISIYDAWITLQPQLNYCDLITFKKQLATAFNDVEVLLYSETSVANQQADDRSNTLTEKGNRHYLSIMQPVMKPDVLLTATPVNEVVQTSGWIKNKVLTTVDMHTATKDPDMTITLTTAEVQTVEVFNHAEKCWADLGFAGRTALVVELELDHNDAVYSDVYHTSNATKIVAHFSNVKISNPKPEINAWIKIWYRHQRTTDINFKTGSTKLNIGPSAQLSTMQSCVKAWAKGWNDKGQVQIHKAELGPFFNRKLTNKEYKALCQCYTFDN